MFSEKKEKIKKAIIIGVLGAICYFSLSVARNVLSVVTPAMKAEGFNEDFFGTVSSIYFIAYGVGQLINGYLGEKINYRLMVCIGLFFGGICNILFANLIQSKIIAFIAYGCTGYFLSMIFAPLTKLNAENNEPIYATRCCLGLQVGSLLGSPMAGLIVAIGAWQTVFNATSAFMMIVAIVCFFWLLKLEKQGVIVYNREKVEVKKKNGANYKELIKRGFLKMCGVRIVCNIVTTTLLFWLSLYFVDHLNFSKEVSPLLYSVVTGVIAFSPFVSIAIYEVLKRKMYLTMFLFFALSSVCFLGAFFIKNQIINLILVGIGIFASNAGAALTTSAFSVSVRDLGLVSFSTGFLDFIAYMSSAIFSSVFAHIVTDIGWNNIVLLLIISMAFGAFLMLPFREIFRKRRIEQ